MPGDCIVWFRQDLRLEDNPALNAAVARGGAVVPVFVRAPGDEGDWPPGAASRVWLHHSLMRLDERLRAAGSRLILRQGDAATAIHDLIRETGAKAVCWNRRYEPAAAECEARLAHDLTLGGIKVERFDGGLLAAPDAVLTRQGRPFRMYTAYLRRFLEVVTPLRPQPAPERISRPRSWPASLTVDALGLLPQVDWASGIRAAWVPGEAGAQQRLRAFLDQGLENYAAARNFPAEPGTSRLSPHLHFGEISPRQVWHAVLQSGRGVRIRASAEKFLGELVWREFAHHLLAHFPHTPDEPLRPEFAAMPWKKSARLLKAWQRGETGFPIVDAGMRQLWETGWMHNRVRMIAASFLVKDLLLPWQAGARWFWDTLVDADLANNTLGWQWSAGCGADAAPFFRIFNPVRQGERFDPQGTYVRRWLSELRDVPDKFIHQPWKYSGRTLTARRSGARPRYPAPVADHAAAREEALAAFAVVQNAARAGRSRGSSRRGSG